MVHTVPAGPQNASARPNDLTPEQVQQRKYQLWTSERR